jgi:hypothetical protein
LESFRVKLHCEGHLQSRVVSVAFAPKGRCHFENDAQSLISISYKVMAYVRHEVVEFTGVPDCPTKVVAAHLEKCHSMLVGEANRLGGCKSAQSLACKSRSGALAKALQVAKGGRSKLLWKPIRHYFSRACQCLVPHDDLRATTKVHYILELSCTLEVHARRPVPWPVVLFLFLFSFSLGFGPFGWPSHLSTDSAPFPLGIKLPIGSLKVNSLLFMIHCSEEQGRSGGAPADGSRGATR